MSTTGKQLTRHIGTKSALGSKLSMSNDSQRNDDTNDNADFFDGLDTETNDKNYDEDFDTFSPKHSKQAGAPTSVRKTRANFVNVGYSDVGMYVKSVPISATTDEAIDSLYSPIVLRNLIISQEKENGVLKRELDGLKYTITNQQEDIEQKEDEFQAVDTTKRNTIRELKQQLKDLLKEEGLQRESLRNSKLEAESCQKQAAYLKVNRAALGIIPPEDRPDEAVNNNNLTISTDNMIKIVDDFIVERSKGRPMPQRKKEASSVERDGITLLKDFDVRALPVELQQYLKNIIFKKFQAVDELQKDLNLRKQSLDQLSADILELEQKNNNMTISFNKKKKEFNSKLVELKIADEEEKMKIEALNHTLSLYETNLRNVLRPQLPINHVTNRKMPKQSAFRLNNPLSKIPQVK